MAVNINKQLELNSFILFPKFPAEIQFKIWGWAAISESRVIKLKVWARNTAYDPNYVAPVPARYFWADPGPMVADIRNLSTVSEDVSFTLNSTNLPGMFTACTTSRKVMLETYSTITFPNGKHICFNQDTDTILIYNDSKRHDLKPLPAEPDEPESHPDYVQIFKDVKAVAVGYDGYFDNYDRPSIWFLEQFKALKTLILYDEPGEDNAMPNKALVKGKDEVKLVSVEEAMAGKWNNEHEQVEDLESWLEEVDYVEKAWAREHPEEPFPVELKRTCVVKEAIQSA